MIISTADIGYVITAMIFYIVGAIHHKYFWNIRKKNIKRGKL